MNETTFTYEEMSKTPKRPGIYCIRNSVSSRCYIGQAVGLRQRLRGHLKKLGDGTHSNKHLQQDFDAHGAPAFTFTILEHLAHDPRYWDAIEGAWVCFYQEQGISLYNIASTCPWDFDYVGDWHMAIRP